jgi:hypothetical protein
MAIYQTHTKTGAIRECFAFVREECGAKGEGWAIEGHDPTRHPAEQPRGTLPGVASVGWVVSTPTALMVPHVASDAQKFDVVLVVVRRVLVAMVDVDVIGRAAARAGGLVAAVQRPSLVAALFLGVWGAKVRRAVAAFRAVFGALRRLPAVGARNDWALWEAREIDAKAAL